MASPEMELSDEGKKHLEEITLAAFHNLLIDVTNQVSRHLASNVTEVMDLQRHSTMQLIEKIDNPAPCSNQSPTS